jgi:hypothetical protein
MSDHCCKPLKGKQPFDSGELKRGEGERLQSGFQKSLLWSAGEDARPGYGSSIDQTILREHQIHHFEKGFGDLGFSRQSVFWDILIDHYQHVRGACCLHLQGMGIKRNTFLPHIRVNQFCIHKNLPTCLILLCLFPNSNL